MESNIGDILERGRSDPRLAERLPEAEAFAEKIRTDAEALFADAGSAGELLSTVKSAELLLGQLESGFKQNYKEAMTKDEVDEVTRSLTSNL